MATTPNAVTGTYCSRESAALILFKHLGQHGWHKDLMCSAERTRAHRGYKHSGQLLYPRCLYLNKPYYSLREIMQFVQLMQRRYPELEPSGIKCVQLRVSTQDQRAIHGPHGFRMNKAQKA